MVGLRDIPVGPSRHLVRFVEADGELWALKELPPRIAAREYDVLRRIEDTGSAAVRAAGVVLQPDDDAAVLRDPLPRAVLAVPAAAHADAARRARRTGPGCSTRWRSLLVDLHRNGVFWGDCSLANTLFTRDGQVLQAWMVDAETAEIHPA